MADKRYDQFAAGDFSDTTKVFLIANPVTGELEKVTVAQLLAAAVPFKVYVALLFQSGANSPTATILENTLGEVPTFGAYGLAGSYTINTIGAVFTANKTYSPQNGNAFFNENSGNTFYLQASRASNFSVAISSFDSAGTKADDLINSGTGSGGLFFQIFVFN